MASSSSADLYSITFGEQNPWKFLGFGWYKDGQKISRFEALKSIKIKIEPIHFKEFLSSATSEIKSYIFTNKEVEAISDDIDEDVGTLNMSDKIRLLFDYRYICDIVYDGKVIQTINFTPLRHDLAFFLYALDIAIETLNPSFVSLSLAPGKNIDYVHDPEIDIEVYYRWEEKKTINQLGSENSEQELHLWITQEYIPDPLEAPKLEDDYGWSFLGLKYINRLTKRRNQLDFRKQFEFGDVFDRFVNSFPQGRLSERIKAGMAVVVCTVITPAKRLDGLQLKKVYQSKNEGILRLELGRVLHYNPDFEEKLIRVNYRWRGEFLELSMKIHHWP